MKYPACAGSGTAEQTIQSALDFVQSNVRYLGIEFGPNSYHPTDPATVLNRRFGDCKDKTFLLCTLLRGLGFEASPVLIATGFRQTLPDLLPAPHDFDHVIVRVTANGKVYWIDPTASYQHGPIGQRSLPDYGYGLVIRTGERGLTSIPPSGAEAMTMTMETFTVGGQKAPAFLEVVNTFKGADAESMRAFIAASGSAGVEKSYLNDYSRRYPGVAMTEPIAIQDSTNNDEISIRVPVHDHEFLGLVGRQAQVQLRILSARHSFLDQQARNNYAVDAHGTRVSASALCPDQDSTSDYFSRNQRHEPRLRSGCRVAD